MSRFGGWIAAALAFATMLAVGPARAQDRTGDPASPEPGSASAGAAPGSRPLTGRALVYLDAEEGVDEFVRVFVFEVVRGRLRDHGLAVSRGEASDSRPSAMVCLRDRGCARALQREHGAPLVLAFHIARAQDELLVTWRRSDAISEAPASIQDNEGGVAAALARTLMELQPERLPCVAQLETELDVALTVDGAAAQSPVLVEPGEHRARAVTAGRAPWSGSLRCAGGRVLRIAVR